MCGVFMMIHVRVRLFSAWQLNGVRVRVEISTREIDVPVVVPVCIS
jgi:hypothetical protein